MNSRALIVLLVVAVLVVSGCTTLTGSRKNKEEPPKVYVTPCRTAGKGIVVTVKAASLTPERIKPALENAFLIDFDLPGANTASSSHTIRCYWGTNVGERKDLYYCTGKYKTPEIDESMVIRRYVWKEYKIGFQLESHGLGSTVDSKGRTVDRGRIYYLTIKEIISSCYLG